MNKAIELYCDAMAADEVASQAESIRNSGSSGGWFGYSSTSVPDSSNAAELVKAKVK